jgi:hypothetical protein
MERAGCRRGRGRRRWKLTRSLSIIRPIRFSSRTFELYQPSHTTRAQDEHLLQLIPGRPRAWRENRSLVRIPLLKNLLNLADHPAPLRDATVFPIVADVKLLKEVEFAEVELGGVVSDVREVELLRKRWGGSGESRVSEVIQGQGRRQERGPKGGRGGEEKDTLSMRAGIVKKSESDSCEAEFDSVDAGADDSDDSVEGVDERAFHPIRAMKLLSADGS